MLGKQSGGAGEGGQLPGQADQPERRGQAPLPHGPAIKGRIPPARLPARSPTSGKCTSHLGFGLVGKYPEAAAKLLIHLGKTEQNPWTWYRAKEIFDKLLLSDLESETEVSLKATAAKVVLW